MSSYQKLALATTAAILSFAVVGTKTAQAAIISYDFTVDVTSGSLNGSQPSGSFSYDDSTLTGSGLETLGVDKGLSVSFNFLGKTYKEIDDIEFPEYPLVQFQDRKLLGLNFTAYSPSSQFFGIGDTVDLSAGLIGPGGGNVFAYNTNGSSNQFEGVGKVTYSARPVPEPASVAGIGALGLGFLLQKKVASRRKVKATADIIR